MVFATNAVAQARHKVEIVPSIGHTHEINSVAFSPDGARLLSGSADKTIKLWNATTGSLVRTLEGHSDMVTSVAFSPDGAHVISGGLDKTVRLWDTATGSLVRTFEGHSERIGSVVFSSDGALLLSGADDRTARLWDLATGRLVRTFEGRWEFVLSVSFSPDGARVLSLSRASYDNTVRLWDAATGRLLRAFEWLSGSISSVALSPDGARLLSAKEYDATFSLSDAISGALLRTYGGQADRVESVAFSPDGARLVSGNGDKTLKLWDAAGGNLVRVFQGHSERVTSVAFSPDGARLASGSFDKTVKLWDVATGNLVRSLEGHSNSVMWVAFSPDGTQVVSGSADKTAKLWDAATGALVRTFEGHSGSVWSAAFSPDGTQLVSAGPFDKAFRLWEVGTGRLLRTFAGHSDAVSSVRFSPGGARLASGSFDKTVKLWDVATGNLVRTFEGHSDQVFSIAFSPDGSHVVSGGLDKTLKLWDAATGGLVRNFEGHSGRVESVAFSPDGRRITSAGLDGTTRIWDARIDAARHEQRGWLLATFVGGRAGADQWLSMTPQFFFNGPRAGNEILAIVRGPALTTLDQVHQSLFNPDLLRESLAGDLHNEVRGAGEVISLEKVLDSGPAPTVDITSHAEGGQSIADTVTLQARIADKGKGVGRVEWRINGVTAAVANKQSNGGPQHTVTQILALDPGHNTIEVTAYNGSNLLASVPARTTIKFVGTPDRAKPKLYVLAIGINKYVDQGWTAPGGTGLVRFGPLGLAVKDAATLAEDLRRAAGGQYAHVSVSLALDQEATRDNLDRVIRKLAAEIHPRDTFVFFAAAHGISNNGRFYLIPQDYSGGPNPNALESAAIGQDQLQDWLSNLIQAKKAIILLDTCESGALVAGHMRSRTDSAASEAGVGRLHEATGRPVLTAAALGQFAYEGVIARSGNRHGLFTWALLDALRNGDTNGSGSIELSELVNHVQTLVPKLAADLGGTGRSAFAVLRPLGVEQAARFGSRGEDFTLVTRIR
jgi:WD40 repeat protein